MSSSNSELSIVVAGGGTAGHIEPALAVAESLRERYNASVSALGTARGLEVSLVPDRGFDLHLIEPVPMPRKLSVDLLKLPIRIVKALSQTRKILKDTRAQAVIGFGGYVSAPAYLAARTLGIPFFAHEANARAGMANKVGVKIGGIGLNAVSGSGMAGDVVGIPIRRNLTGSDNEQARARAQHNWNLDLKHRTILITGGSQGSKSINDAVEGALPDLLAAGYQVVHALGKNNERPPVQAGYVPVAFIDDMEAAYAAADLIICRAGAMTVAEVSAAGIPAIYIPLPHGNGEQALNAQEVIAAGAARLLPDQELNASRLVAEISAVLADSATFNEMKKAASEATVGNAADVIADLIVTRINTMKS